MAEGMDARRVASRVGRLLLPARPSAPATPPGRARLVVVGGPSAGLAFPLDGAGPWLVGRGPRARMRIAGDQHLSRAHLRVRRAGPGYTVEALRGATNPATLDSLPLTPGAPAPLRPGAIVVAGTTQLVFQAP